MSTVAKRVHDRIMACSTDAEAALYAAIVVGGVLTDDMASHQEVLQHRVDQVIAKRQATLKDGVLRSYVAKRASGDPVEGLLAAAEIIAKAGFIPNRDDQGQFAAVESRRTRTKVSYPVDRNRALTDKQAKIFGIPGGQNKMSEEEKARYQQAYVQVAQILAPYSQHLPGDSVVHMTYLNGAGRPKTETVEMPDDPRTLSANVLNHNAFREGGRLVEVGVSVAPGLSVQGAAFNLVGALGEQPGLLAARAMETDSNGHFKAAVRTNSFATEWNAQDPDSIADNRGGLFRRISSGSRFLSSLVGEHAPPRVKLALGAADFVGQYGVEAEKVVGPHADRVAYRYRGVEKAPDPSLQNNINAVRSRHGNTPAGQDSARNELIYGRPSEHVPGKQKWHEGTTTEPQPSPLVNYLKRRLAKPELLNLQRQSGVIPPSQGIIIDRKGKIVTEAVGYGEDWYLPFNLKTLSRVNGGEYIRTRAWGGPTTEDIYAGLVSGARAVTVVSHSGVFTIEFDDAFRGSRRYNDKAGRMVKRYGHLLDAVKSKQVTLTGIPADRADELQAQADAEFDPKYSRDQNTAARKQLENDERANPTMSKVRVTSLAEEFLDDFAISLPSKNGQVASWTSVATDYVNGKVARDKALAPPYETFDEAGSRAAAAASVRTPMQVIEVADQKPQWDKFMANKQAEYVAEQSPLNLNGAGYDKSMQALKEQFPYYISSATWQPERPHQSDVGYIKPNHTRPAMVLSGYYDQTIEGTGKELTNQGKPTGKVTADQTRWQGRLDPTRAVARLGNRPDPTGTTPDAGGGPRRFGPPSSPLVAALKGQEDVAALYDHVRGQASGRTPAGTVFAVDALLADPAGGQDMRTKLPTVFGKTKAEFMSEYTLRPDAAKRALMADVARIRQMNMFDLDPAKVDRVLDPEKAARGREYSSLAALETPESPNADYDFKEELDPGHLPQRYKIKAKQLMNTIGMSNNEVEDATLPATLDAFIEVQRAQLSTAQRRMGGPKINEVEVERKLKTAVMVKQALRRYTKASEIEAVPAAPSNGGITLINVGENEQLPPGLAQQLGFTGSAAPTPSMKDPNDNPTAFWAQMGTR